MQLTQFRNAYVFNDLNLVVEIYFAEKVNSLVLRESDMIKVINGQWVDGFAIQMFTKVELEHVGSNSQHSTAYPCIVYII